MYGYVNTSRCHVLIYIFKSLYDWYVYEPIYMAIYVCGLVCKHMVVVVHVWQGFMTWVHYYMIVHDHMIIPSMVIGQCLHELCIKVSVVIILCIYASRYIRDICTCICLRILRFQNDYKWFRARMIIVLKKRDQLWT